MGTELTQARPERPGRSNGIQQVAKRNTQPYIQRTRILQPAVQTTTSHSPPAPPAFCLNLGPEMKRERDNGEEGLDACYQSALTLLHWTRQHRTGQANSSSSFSPQSGPKIQPEGQVWKGANERRMSDHTQSVRLVHSASPKSTILRPKSN